MMKEQRPKDFQQIGESEEAYFIRTFSEKADSEKMCVVTGCVRERYFNWSTCDEHEARGARVFDLQ